MDKIIVPCYIYFINKNNKILAYYYFFEKIFLLYSTHEIWDTELVCKIRS